MLVALPDNNNTTLQQVQVQVQVTPDDRLIKPRVISEIRKTNSHTNNRLHRPLLGHHRISGIVYITGS